jgi:UDP-N-acetyl-D-mannosaminuronate dehydrogenase
VEVLRADGLDEAVAAADLVILVQNHREYDADLLAAKSRRFLDTRDTSTGDVAYRL